MVRLQNAHVEAFPDIYRPFGLDDAKSHLESNLALPDTTIRVASDDKTVAGHMVLKVEERPQSMFTHAQRYGHVCQIEVDPDYRRIGLGRMLLADCDRLAISNNLTRIVLEVWEFNTSARTFFRDFGYVDFGSKMIRRTGS